MSSSQNKLFVFLMFFTVNKSVLTNANTIRTINSTAVSSTQPLVMHSLSAISIATIPRTEQKTPMQYHWHPLQRVKRQQEGESKYSQASKMGDIKVLRLLAQMLVNPFSSEFIGGAHPFHPEVPKSIVILFKQKIMAFLFPRIGSRW